jgi:hypothetical protein
MPLSNVLPEIMKLKPYILIFHIIRIIRSGKMSWAGHVVRMGERRSAYRILVGKPEGTRPL